MEKKITLHPLILNRWSPRAMSGEPVSQEQLFSLFEAARLAPSSYNGQPWRFLYALQNTPSFEKMFSLLVPFNQTWAKNASSLILILSRTLFTHNQKPCKTHSFDTGSASENLALQGSYLNLVIHMMEGFDYHKARELFQISDLYTIEAMIAVGKPAAKETLPLELQKDEHKRERRPLKELISEGVFRFD